MPLTQGQTMLCQVIDLCGRDAPQIVDVQALPDVCGLLDDDIDHILEMWADGNSAFIGEFEYREISDAA